MGDCFFMESINDDYVGRDYFPEITKHNKENPLKSKYGILNVGLVKNSKVVTGLQWNYSYYDGERIRVIHSYDLRILRKKVLSVGEDWIITDNRQAIDTYKKNNELVKLHDSVLNETTRRNRTGVKYVSKNHSTKYKTGYYFMYHESDNKRVTSAHLKDLKVKVLNNGWEWIIIDEERYLNALKLDEDGVYE